MVLKFDPRDPEAGVVTLYSDDGARISAGTVAARWRETQARFVDQPASTFLLLRYVAA